jgi:hypothetical protein
MRPKKELQRPSPCLEIDIRRERKIWSRSVVGCLSDFRMFDSSSGKLAVLPIIPDLNSRRNHMSGIIQRYACDMPDGDRRIRELFALFCKRLIPLKFTPPDLKAFTTLQLFEDWLAHSSYSGWQREKLRRIRNEITHHGIKPQKMKEIVDSLAFTKWEGWDEPKYPRMINSPSDYTKVLLGPILHAIDKATYAGNGEDSHFVKGLDPKTWPAMLLDLFGDDTVAETDFTSMEAHHEREMIDVVSFWIRHMMRGMPFLNRERRLIARMMLGTNKSYFSTCTAKIDQRLMSGVLWTSSSNGVLNLMIMLFLKHYHPLLTLEEMVAAAAADKKVKVEGDDGITSVRPERAEHMTQLAELMGFKLKLEPHISFTEAKFCSLIFDRDVLQVLPDPKKVLRKFFLLPPALRDCKESKKRSMIRAKGMSYSYLFHNAPVIGELAHRVCQLTAGLTVNPSLGLGWMVNLGLEKALADKKTWLLTRPQVDMRSRVLVEERFGVSVNQQLLMERQIRESGPTFLVACDFMRGMWDDEHQGKYFSAIRPELQQTYEDKWLTEVCDRGLAGLREKSLGVRVEVPTRRMRQIRKLHKAVLRYSCRKTWAGYAVEPL